MRILYLSDAVIPSEASRSLSIMRVCQAFADAGHDVLLCAIAPSKKHPDPVAYYGLRGGFTVRCDSFGAALYNDVTRWFLLGGFLHAWKTRAVLKKFAPDLVYSRLTISELAFVPKNIPILYEMHSLGPLGQTWVRRMGLRWIMRHKNVRRLIVTTNTLAEWLGKELAGIEIVIARLSAEPPVEIAEKELARFRKENLAGKFSNNVGYTGFLDTKGLRGTDILCQAASQMPDVGVHIVGGEPAIVKYWKEYAKTWNTHGNIFFYGYRNPSEMPFFLGLFDVVLAPLQFKTAKRAMSPLKLSQYLGYGKAIVASDIPSHREILQDGATALLVPHDDVARWVLAIRKLLDSPEKRTAMGRAARTVYDAELTPQKRIEKILGSL